MSTKNELLIRIDERYPKFSKGQKRLADYIKENYDKAAFLTAAKMGEAVGVSESTVVRFATQLGYKGYPEFQKALGELVRTKLNSIQRMEVTYGRIDRSEILATVLQSDIEKIKQTLESVDNHAFELAVDTILAAKKVYVIGIRSCAPLAKFLTFYLNLICEDVVVFFRERPGRLQWMGIIFAGIGVLIPADGIWSRPVGLTECGPFRGVVCVLSQTRHGRSRSGMLMELLSRAVPVGLPEHRGRAFPRRRRIHGSAAHRLRIRLRHSPIGPEPRHPQRADDLRWASCNTFCRLRFSCSAHSSCANPYRRASCWCSCSSGWVLGASCPVPSFCPEEKAPAGNGNRAGEVLRNEGFIEP